MDFHLGSLFTSEVEVGEGGMTFLPPFFHSFPPSVKRMQSYTIFAANHPNRH